VINFLFVVGSLTAATIMMVLWLVGKDREMASVGGASQHWFLVTQGDGCWIVRQQGEARKGTIDVSQLGVWSVHGHDAESDFTEGRDTSMFPAEFEGRSGFSKVTLKDAMPPSFSLKRFELWAIKVPYWAALLLLLTAPTVSSLRLARRAMLALSGRCVHCGYDLRASPERCPECGRSRNSSPEIASSTNGPP